jgi:hypothetical protein
MRPRRRVCRRMPERPPRPLQRSRERGRPPAVSVRRFRASSNWLKCSATEGFASARGRARRSAALRRSHRCARRAGTPARGPGGASQIWSAAQWRSDGPVTPWALATASRAAARSGRDRGSTSSVTRHLAGRGTVFPSVELDDELAPHHRDALCTCWKRMKAAVGLEPRALGAQLAGLAVDPERGCVVARNARAARRASRRLSAPARTGRAWS